MFPIPRRAFLASALAAPFAFAAEPKLRVAVIGHTKRGDYGHGLDTMWLRLPETELVAVADADASGLDKAKAKLKVEGFSDSQAMLRAVKPDLVAIAPRHLDQHRDMILTAIEAGAKGIYVEKPYCRTPAEADEIAAALAKSKTKLAVAHRNRFHPVLPVVAMLIADGEIGQVLELRGRGKEDHRGGALDLWVLGSHVFNLATYYAGAPKACTATLMKNGKLAVKADITDGAEGVGPIAGDEVHARFEMAKGMPLFFDSIANAGVKDAGFGLQIVGTKGVIDFRVDVEPLAHLRRGNPFRPVKDASAWIPITSGGVGVPEPIPNLAMEVSSHALAARELIAAMREDREPACGPKEAMQTVEMISACFLSHVRNGVRVEWPMAERKHAFAAG